MMLFSRKKFKNAKFIKQAIDTYPSGISFSTLNGRPILVNDKMNSLIYILTGHAMIEVNSTWDELNRGMISKSCSKFLIPDILKNHIDTKNSIAFMMNDNTVWSFQRTTLYYENSSMVQITADNITNLYNMTTDLYHKNKRLKELHNRQKNLLANIVKINTEKELLDAKIYIHDELGQCLLMTKKALSEDTIADDKKIITKKWLDTLKALVNVSDMPKAQKASPEIELLNVAKMIGCKINFTGEKIESRKIMLLIFAATREALTNAVRHANANEVSVDIKTDENNVYAEIFNNSREGAVSVKEGSGLSSLRKRIEQEGAELTIDSTNGVILKLKIKKEEN